MLFFWLFDFDVLTFLIRKSLQVGFLHKSSVNPDFLLLLSIFFKGTIFHGFSFQYKIVRETFIISP